MALIVTKDIGILLQNRGTFLLSKSQKAVLYNNRSMKIVSANVHIVQND